MAAIKTCSSFEQCVCQRVEDICCTNDKYVAYFRDRTLQGILFTFDEALSRVFLPVYNEGLPVLAVSVEDYYSTFLIWENYELYLRFSTSFSFNLYNVLQHLNGF